MENRPDKAEQPWRRFEGVHESHGRQQAGGSGRGQAGTTRTYSSGTRAGQQAALREGKWRDAGRRGEHQEAHRVDTWHTRVPEEIGGQVNLGVATGRRGEVRGRGGRGGRSVGSGGEPSQGGVWRRLGNRVHGGTRTESSGSPHDRGPGGSSTAESCSKDGRLIPGQEPNLAQRPLPDRQLSKSESRNPIEEQQGLVADSAVQRGGRPGQSRALVVKVHQSGASVADDDGREGSDWPAIVGLCLDMCPESERVMRERLHDIAVFESIAKHAPHRTSKDLAVKKFSRTMSSAHIRPSDIRPLPVLQRTMAHLLALLDSPSHPFASVYDFVFDRTRAVRQELSMQRIRGRDAIEAYKPIVRFHILAGYELCEAPAEGAMGAAAPYDPHLNAQQLSKALATLLGLYEEEARDQHQSGTHPEEGEFLAYRVLLNLGPHGSFQPDSLSHWLSRLRSSALHSPAVRFARAVLRCYRAGNYWGFCQLARSATLLQACLLHPHLTQMRQTALAAITYGGYKAQPYPLARLAELLLFEKTSDVETFCVYYGLAVGTYFGDSPALLVKEGSMKVPDRPFPLRRSPFIDRNRRPTRLEEVMAS